MSWTVTDAEFEAVTSLAARERYDYFIKRAASHGELFGLHDQNGWVIAEDADGAQHFSVWPHERYAAACAGGSWSTAIPTAIDIDDWVEAWLPRLTEDGLRISVFQTADDEGSSVSADRLKSDLDDELSLFGR